MPGKNIPPVHLAKKSQRKKTIFVTLWGVLVESHTVSIVDKKQVTPITSTTKEIMVTTIA
jgi:hypothetical protein